MVARFAQHYIPAPHPDISEKSTDGCPIRASVARVGFFSHVNQTTPSTSANIGNMLKHWALILRLVLVHAIALAQASVFVLGHSIGGLFALEAAFRTKKIFKLVLYEPPLQDLDNKTIADQMEQLIQDSYWQQDCFTPTEQSS